MTHTIGSRIGRQLYDLLPEVYRERDRSGDLAKYVDSCGELFDSVYDTLQQRLADHFPETCQEWLIPYFAELLDVALKSPEPEGRRAEVSRAIDWRKRKGTATCTEEIAEAVGAMEVELQEGWRRVARTAMVGEELLPAALLGGSSDPARGNPLTANQHPGLPVATVDFRRRSRAVRAAEPNLVTHRTHFPGSDAAVLWSQANPRGVPCFPGSYEDQSLRTLDVRTANWSQGHFHPKRLLAFVPPAVGFFADGALRFNWQDLLQAGPGQPLDKLEEPELQTSAGVFIRRTHFFIPGATPVTVCVRTIESSQSGAAPTRTTYSRPAAVTDTIRISGPIDLLAPADPRHSHRFEGFYIDDALKVGTSRLELERCAVFRVEVPGQLPEVPVLTAVDCLLRHVQALGGLVQLECCTVLAKTLCDAIRAVDCLFLGELQRQDTVSGLPPRILCLRHVRVPPELPAAFVELATDSQLERQLKHEQRNRIQRFTIEVPVFFRLGFGVAGAGVLHPATPASIRTGAEDGGELGAYHHQHLCLRETAVRDKLAEYLPFGIEAVLIPDERLRSAPPEQQ